MYKYLVMTQYLHCFYLSLFPLIIVLQNFYYASSYLQLSSLDV